MADQELSYKLTIDDDGSATIEKVTNDLDSLNGETQKTDKSFAGLTSTMGAVKTAIAAIGVYALVNQMKALAQEAGQDEKAFAGLHQTLIATGRYSEQYERKIVALTATIQKNKNIEDDVAAAAAKKLIVYDKISNESLPHVMDVTADLAAFTEMSMVSAARYIGMASEGMTTMLSRYGIRIDEAIVKSGDWDKILGAIEAKVKGSAEALANTNIGQWEQLGLIWGDMRENIGEIVFDLVENMLPVLITIATKTKEIAGNIDDWWDLNVNTDETQMVLKRLETQSAFYQKQVEAFEEYERKLIAGEEIPVKAEMLERELAKYRAALNNVEGSLLTLNNEMLKTGDIAEDSGKKGSKANEKETEAIKQYTAKIKELTLGATEYKLWSIQQEIDAAVTAYGPESEAVRVMRQYYNIASTETAEAAANYKAFLEGNQKEYEEALKKDEDLLKQFVEGNQTDWEELQKSEQEYYDDLQDNMTKAYEGQLKYDEDQLKAEEEKNKEIMEKWEHTLENIHDETASVFKDIFKGNIKDWQDLFDSIRDYFFDVLAEMAAKAVEEEILIPIVAKVKTEYEGSTISSLSSSGGGWVALIAAGLVKAFSTTEWWGASDESLSKFTDMVVATETVNDSVKTSYEILSKIYSVEYEGLRDLNSSLKDLNQGISNLVSDIAINYGAGSGTFDITTGMSYGGAAGKAIGINETINRYLGWLGIDETFGDNLTGKIVNAIFGGKTTTGIMASGIAISTPTVGEIEQGGWASSAAYADVKTHVEGGWFHSSYDTWQRYWESLDESTYLLIASVYDNISDTLVYLAGEFGVNMQETLAYAFGYAEVNLVGQTAEQVNQTLTTFFSSVGNNAVEALFGSFLEEFKKYDEELLETATRVIQDKVIVMDILEKTNQVYSASTKELIEFSEAMISFSGDLSTLQSNFTSYYNSFFTEEERKANLKEDITSALSGYGFNFPESKQSYRELIESLDLSTKAGQENYAILLSFSQYVAEYYNSMDNLIDSIDNMTETIQDWLNEQTVSGLAPVTSAETYETMYNKLLENATSSDEAMSDFLSFATTYLSFMQSYSGDYKEIYNDVMEDVKGFISGSYASGTDYVPTTGIYKLHQGESVVSGGFDSAEIGNIIGSHIVAAMSKEDSRFTINIDGKNLMDVIISQGKTNQEYQKFHRRIVNG